MVTVPVGGSTHSDRMVRSKELRPIFTKLGPSWSHIKGLPSLASSHQALHLVKELLKFVIKLNSEKNKNFIIPFTICPLFILSVYLTALSRTE